MKHPRARAVRFLSCVTLCALSACSTTSDKPTQPAVAAPAPSAVAPDVQGKQYYIFGEVSAQGAQAFDGDTTVFEAVTRAQPRKDSANLGRVRLIRADPRDPMEWTIDLLHIMQTGDSSQNLHVQERDVIYVPPAAPVEPKR